MSVYQLGDLVAHRIGMETGETFHTLLHDVSGTEACTKRFGDGLLDGICLLREIERVTKEHGCAQDRCQRIRNVLSGDVGC